MTHKQFQHNTDEGGTDVQFNLEYDGQHVMVTNIQLHSNFKSGLPNNAYLEYNPQTAKWHLTAHYLKEGPNETPIQTIEWLNSKIANDILEKIIDIKERESPKFTVSKPPFI